MKTSKISVRIKWTLYSMLLSIKLGGHKTDIYLMQGLRALKYGQDVLFQLKIKGTKRKQA